MKDLLEQMLDRHLPLPGVVAWVARFGDGAIVSRSLAGRITPGIIEQSLHTLLLTAETLRGQHLIPETVSLVFERARLCVAFRDEVCCLALFVENNLEAKALAETLLEDFQKL